MKRKAKNGGSAARDGGQKSVHYGDQPIAEDRGRRNASDRGRRTGTDHPQGVPVSDDQNSLRMVPAGRPRSKTFISAKRSSISITSAFLSA